MFLRGIWPVIRKKLIIIKHQRVAHKLHHIVDNILSGKYPSTVFRKKMDLPENGQIIWQYWAQGYDSKLLPELVKICLDSVEKNTGDYKLIRLSDKNLSEYIDLPPYIETKRGVMSYAHFADLLRLILLATYGGVWLDASTLLTGKLPEMFSGRRFFMYQRDANEPHKDYWENSFACYWGWYKGFRVNVLNGIMYSDAENGVIKDLCSMLLSFWKDNNQVPDYFFFHILFDLYIKQNPSKNCPIVNDCIPHMLRQVINAEYPYRSVEEILSITPIHSLNYKNPNAANRLKEILHSIT